MQAERQNALRDEYEKEREEMLERLGETNRARNVVIGMSVVGLWCRLRGLGMNYAAEFRGWCARSRVEMASTNRRWQTLLLGY